MSQLSIREAEILRLVAAGLSVPEIARELAISENAVVWHLTNVLERVRATAAAGGTEPPPYRGVDVPGPQPARPIVRPARGLARVRAFAVGVALLSVIIASAPLVAVRTGIVPPRHAPDPPATSSPATTPTSTAPATELPSPTPTPPVTTAPTIAPSSPTPVLPLPLPTAQAVPTVQPIPLPTLPLPTVPLPTFGIPPVVPTLPRAVLPSLD